MTIKPNSYKFGVIESFLRMGKLVGYYMTAEEILTHVDYGLNWHHKYRYSVQLEGIGGSVRFLYIDEDVIPVFYLNKIRKQKLEKLNIYEKFC